MPHFRKANLADYDRVMALFDNVTDAMQGQKFSPRWKKGVYPEPDVVRDQIAKGNLYVGVLDNLFVSTFTLNHEPTDGYDQVAWPTEASPDKVAIIHLVAVRGECQHRGYALQAVQEALHIARDAGNQVMRLDVCEYNAPITKLYELAGFYYVDTIPLFYTATGTCGYLMYECKL
ncbi:MAG: GNAT family N-acetyltransferase [Eggerthellaceae bacterium]